MRPAIKFRVRAGFFGVVVCAFGFLLWSRLLLVTKPPRVAMASEVAGGEAPAKGQTPKGQSAKLK